MSSSNWTGGRRKLKKPKINPTKTLVVSDPAFFTKRDKRGLVPKDFEFSEAMLRAAREQFEHIVIFNPKQKRVRDQISKFLETLEIDGVEVCSYARKDIEATTSFWKTTLMELGASFRRTRNPREMTYLNLHTYMTAPHITWVGPDDHSKIKINLEKDKTFQELQKVRRSRAEW